VCVWRKKTESFISHPKLPAAENQIPGGRAAGHITIIDNASTSQQHHSTVKRMVLPPGYLASILKITVRGKRLLRTFEEFFLKKKDDSK
jgi:hypothetical protein